MNRRGFFKGLGAAAALLVLELKPPVVRPYESMYWRYREMFKSSALDPNLVYHVRNLAGQLFQELIRQQELNGWFNDAWFNREVP